MEESVGMMENNCALHEFFVEGFSLQKQDARMYSPLTLAYIGDGIYDIVIRTIVLSKGNAPVNKLHKESSSYVKAQAQMQMYYAVEDMLTEEEIGIFKRGRNAKSYTSAKNATITEYRNATGFEALMGYLYLSDRMNRVVELVKIGMERLSEKK